jgi:hypothetical protein
MKYLIGLSMFLGSLQASGHFGTVIWSSAPEPVLVALWGISLLTLATGAKSALARKAPARKTT